MAQGIAILNVEGGTNSTAPIPGYAADLKPQGFVTILRNDTIDTLCRWHMDWPTTL